MAIVSGDQYTVEQADQDAKAAWESAGGVEILEWWQNWYENDRDKTFLWEDMREIMIQEDFVNKLK